MREVINFHRTDRNVGDRMSAPSLYFDFPGLHITRAEIAEAGGVDLSQSNVIVGGGGLLDEYFLPFVKGISSRKSRGKLIAWGVGQQIDRGPWWSEYEKFPYKDYLDQFDLVGVRDYRSDLPWVPCASCMHPTFDVPRDPTHEFVVFSHRSRPIPIAGWPTMQNDELDMEGTIDFLASGETIITSSYHGMYWAMLLGRRVLAFPFNSKFLTQKHPVTLYPAIWERPKRSHTAIRALLKKEPSAYVCKSVSGWRLLAGAARRFPEALEECRDANRWFYRRVVEHICP